MQRDMCSMCIDTSTPSDCCLLQVMRELSDKVVEGQETLKEISSELVAQKIRAAQLQTEHDNLISIIKDLVAKQEKQDNARSGKLPTGKKATGSGVSTKRGIGFLNRLKTPRNRD
jgi:hypothetical protein